MIPNRRSRALASGAPTTYETATTPMTAEATPVEWPRPFVTYSTMKLRSPAKPSSSSALAAAKVRIPLLRRTSRTDMARAASCDTRRCSRATGASARVVASSSEPATTKGRGCHRSRKNPPASSATPRPTPRRTPWEACDRA